MEHSDVANSQEAGTEEVPPGDVSRLVLAELVAGSSSVAAFSRSWSNRSGLDTESLVSPWMPSRMDWPNILRDAREALDSDEHPTTAQGAWTLPRLSHDGNKLGRREEASQEAQRS